MFRKMPFILLFTILAALSVSSFLPIESKQVLYAISLTIKSFIVFLLPLIIFSLLFKTMMGLAARASFVIALILIAVCASNTLSTFLSHYMGSWIYQSDFSLIKPTTAESLIPAWTWQFPKWIANEKGMFLGILLGIILSGKPWAKTIAQKLEKTVSFLLQLITYLIPLFIAGFVVKLQSDGSLQLIVKDYTFIFFFIALAQFSYIFIWYGLLNNIKLKQTSIAIKNMLPAAIAGFSTMSSAAAMPLTLLGTKQNVEQKELAASVIPATVNIHLVGDCIAIPIFAYAVMKTFGVAEPSLIAYLTFVFYFVIAKFSVAAIPGGGIIVMLPILESCLGFNADMLSLITALYILFDPIITCANVFGNGAYALAIDKLITLPKKVLAQV